MDTSRIQPHYTFLYKPLDNVQAGGCHLDVWLPNENAQDMFPNGSPVAIMIHGGGFLAGTRSGVPYNQMRYLLGKGVAVVSISYRLIPHVKAKEIRVDLVDAYRFVQDRLGSSLHDAGSHDARLDTARCFVMGWSAGAISSLWMAADVTALAKTVHIHPPKAVIAAYPIADFNSLFNAPLPVGEPDFDQILSSLLEQPCRTDIPHPAGTAASKERYSKDADEKQDGLMMGYAGKAMMAGALSTAIVGSTAPFDEDESPINLITKDFPPTFVMVAEADELIPTTHSEDIYGRLQGLGVKSAKAIARGMKHGEAEVLEGVYVWKADLGWWEEAIKPSLDFALAQL